MANLTSLLLQHLSSSLTDSLPSLNPLCHSKTDAQFMQDGRKAVWGLPYDSVAFFSSLKRNFIAYRSSYVSSRPDCIHHLWQSGFSRVYSNCCCSSLFEPEIIKIGQSSHKMYSNNIVNFQESTTILNACTKKVWKHIEGNNLVIMYVCVFARSCACACVSVCVLKKICQQMIKDLLFRSLLFHILGLYMCFILYFLFWMVKSSFWCSLCSKNCFDVVNSRIFLSYYP